MIVPGLNRNYNFVPYAGATGDVDLGEHGLSAEKLDGLTKWGGMTDEGIPHHVYWTVVPTILLGGLIKLPRLTPTGGGLAAAVGAIANHLYLHADVGTSPMLYWSNNAMSVLCQMQMNETTGQITFSRAGGTSTLPTLWQDHFTVTKDFAVEGDASFDGGVSVDGDLDLNAAPPASASDTGTPGQIRVDENYIYVCTAANTWKRSALSTW